MDNTFEQIEKRYHEQEITAKNEMAKIETAKDKLMEKYGEYEAIKSFVVYLASMEKVFARAKIYSSSPAFVKDEIIKTEMKLMSDAISIDEGVLASIRDDFSLLYLTINQIYEITERLLSKYRDIAGCVDFIQTLKDISLIFIDAHEKHFSINQIQEKIYLAKMKAISASGDPEMKVLENVYEEFKNSLMII